MFNQQQTRPICANITIQDRIVQGHERPANPDTRSIHIFIAQLPGGSLLTFEGNAEHMVDVQTGSVWDPARGLAVEGELTGQALREIPYVTSFDWAWRDFYPHTDFYSG